MACAKRPNEVQKNRIAVPWGARPGDVYDIAGSRETTIRDPAASISGVRREPAVKTARMPGFFYFIDVSWNHCVLPCHLSGIVPSSLGYFVSMLKAKKIAAGTHRRPNDWATCKVLDG